MQRPQLSTLNEQTFDLIIVGGGITGAAAARDAALRGFKVLLVEKDDFAAGTSSRSSKLIHGGLRYLQTYQFKLVAESLREREKMLKLAPHLTEVKPFLYLLYEGDPETPALLNLGLTFYDAASGQWSKRRRKMLSPKEVIKREPHVDRKGLKGGGIYYDVLTDDARLTLDTVKSAAEAGATVINHAKVTDLVTANGRAVGVEITDKLDEQVTPPGEADDRPVSAENSVKVMAKQIINATGPWTDFVRVYETGEDHGGKLRPTKGVHIVVRKEDFPLNTAVFLRSPDDNRVVWPTPSLEEDLVYIGTTDTDFDGDPDHVIPTAEDITYLLNAANRTIPSAKLTEKDIVGSWAGLRPLVAPTPGTTESNTSREHAITTGPTGMITISGGKLTSSRLMAKQLIDAAAKAIKRNPQAYDAAKIPLSGAELHKYPAIKSTAAENGVPKEIVNNWLRRYGSNAEKVLNIWVAEPDSQQILETRNLTIAEVRYCVREEMAASLADLLVRRTSAFFWDKNGGTQDIEVIATEMSKELGWSSEQIAAQIADYTQLVAEHRPAS